MLLPQQIALVLVPLLLASIPLWVCRGMRHKGVGMTGFLGLEALIVGSCLAAAFSGFALAQWEPALPPLAKVGIGLALAMGLVAQWPAVSLLVRRGLLDAGVQHAARDVRRLTGVQLGGLATGMLGVLLIGRALKPVPFLQEDVLARHLIAICLVALVLAALAPTCLGLLWRASRVTDGDLRSGFERLSRRAGLRGLRLRVLETPDSVMGAWIGGIRPGIPTVFLSRGVLRGLSVDEVLALIGHELGHARLRHLWIYTGLVLASLVGSFGAAGLVLPADMTLARGLVGLALFLGVAPFLTLPIVRRCEARADRFAVELLGDARPLASALERIVKRPTTNAKRTLLERLLDTHPTLEQRLRRLRAGSSLTNGLEEPARPGPSQAGP